MNTKKSYMDTKNILTEDFFSFMKNMGRIGAVIRGMKNVKKKKIEKAKKDPTVKKAIKDLNSSVSNLEKYYSKIYDTNVKLDKFSLKDFI